MRLLSMAAEGEVCVEGSRERLALREALPAGSPWTLTWGGGGGHGTALGLCRWAPGAPLAGRGVPGEMRVGFQLGHVAHRSGFQQG